MNKRLQEQHALLIQEFNQYLFDHPEFLKRVPQGAVIVLQLEGDEEYNRWSRRMAHKTQEEEQPLAFVEIRKLAPARSRLVGPRLRLAATP
ncbi:MAG TPA: DUF5647 family protein [Candidatus Binatia bacterium]|nr:DUF5647 family protein [Candidatus Binatia bacterium]